MVHKLDPFRNVPQELAEETLPQCLRQPLIKAMLRSIRRGLIPILKAFRQGLKDDSPKLRYNGQVCYLKAMLEDFTRIEKEYGEEWLIRDSQQEIKTPPFAYANNDDRLLFAYRSGNPDSPFALNNKSVQFDGFVVTSTAGLECVDIRQYMECRKLVRYYCLPTKRFVFDDSGNEGLELSDSLPRPRESGGGGPLEGEVPGSRY